MSREKILIRTSWVSTIGNAILSASKIIVGLFAGSLAVLGDGIDSATDVITVSYTHLDVYKRQILICWMHSTVGS